MRISELGSIIDGHDRRVARKVNDKITARYIWQDQLRVAAELDASGKLRKQFIYADGVNSPEYMVYQGKRYLFVKDHRGSINLVVDVASGEVKQRMQYSEFGEVTEDTNPGFQPFGFAGGLYDSETKLVRFGARDYDGRIGRWLAKDPIRFAGGDSNLYGYVLNDPVNWFDPKGLMQRAFDGATGSSGASVSGASGAAACAVTVMAMNQGGQQDPANPEIPLGQNPRTQGPTPSETVIGVVIGYIADQIFGD